MRRKAVNTAQGDANSNITARDDTDFMMVRPQKMPTPGKGLGKAGAKRLGRLLKRAIKYEESAGKRNAALPKTPFRLLKHQIKTEAETLPAIKPKDPVSPYASTLIHNVISEYKHRGGMSLAELRQTLSAGGFSVTSTEASSQGTKPPNSHATPAQATPKEPVRLNNKKNQKQTDTKSVQPRAVRSRKPKADFKQSKPASKPTKGPQQPRRQAARPHKSKGKPQKPTGKTRKAGAKSHKPRGKRAKTKKNAGRKQKKNKRATGVKTVQKTRVRARKVKSYHRKQKP